MNLYHLFRVNDSGDLSLLTIAYLLSLIPSCIINSEWLMLLQTLTQSSLRQRFSG